MHKKLQQVFLPSLIIIHVYSYRPLEQRTMHNTDVVQRIVEYFLMHEQEQQQLPLTSGKSSVSKLLDNYLAEVAKDPNLSITKFQVLAEALPEKARTCDDGIYRAIDTYLKVCRQLSFWYSVLLDKQSDKAKNSIVLSRLILRSLSMTEKGYAK